MVRAIYEQFYTHITNWHLPHFFLLNDDDAQATTDDDVTDDDKRCSILPAHDEDLMKPKPKRAIKVIVDHTVTILPRPDAVTGIVGKLWIPRMALSLLKEPSIREILSELLKDKFKL